MAPLPAYVPSLVTVYIGKEDGWPYKVGLVGRLPSILMEDTRPIGPDGRSDRLPQADPEARADQVELIYSNVMLNPALQDEDFAFQAPADVRVEDSTESILNGLEQGRPEQDRAEEGRGRRRPNRS